MWTDARCLEFIEKAREGRPIHQGIRVWSVQIKHAEMGTAQAGRLIDVGHLACDLHGGPGSLHSRSSIGWRQLAKPQAARACERALSGDAPFVFNTIFPPSRNQSARPPWTFSFPRSASSNAWRSWANRLPPTSPIVP